MYVFVYMIDLFSTANIFLFTLKIVTPITLDFFIFFYRKVEVYRSFDIYFSLMFQ